MERQLKVTGFFFALVFFIACGIRVAQGIIILDESFVKAFFLDPLSLLLFFLVPLLASSGYVRILVWAQPIIMLALTPLPFLTATDSFYGLGFFVMGIILLFRLGFYEHHRVPKFIISLAYLLGCELYAVIGSGKVISYAFTPIFFICCFLLFLYLAFQEKLAVYLHEPKPLLSLKSKGLSGAECIYVKAIAVGQSTKEIAIDYSVSESTVRNTLSRAYHKLEIEDKTGIIALKEQYEIVD